MHESLGSIGIRLTEDGTLDFDESKLHAQFQRDPESLKSFFTDEDNGAVKKYHDITETLVGRDRSLLVSRSVALGNKIEQNSARIDALTARLEKQRERLFNDFVRMEIAISKIQNNMTSIGQIQAMTPQGGGV